MVRVNGMESGAVLTNMYPDAIIGRDVLHLMDVPAHESSMWARTIVSRLKTDWHKEFGEVSYAARPGLTAILASVQHKANSSRRLRMRRRMAAS